MAVRSEVRPAPVAPRQSAARGWAHRVALIAIFLLAAGLRLWSPDVSEFKLDETEPPTLADQIWQDHQWPLTRGVTSFGLPGTPGLGYLLAIPRALSADPVAPVAFIALLGVEAVAVTYFGVRRFASERLALVCAALLAANPWTVLLARKTWSQVLPLLTVLILWAAFEVVWRRKPGWAALFFILLAAQVQAHLVAIVYLPAALLTVILFWPRWRTRYSAWGVGLGLLLFAPYLWALAAQWGATRATLLHSTGQGLALNVQALAYAVWYGSGKTLTALLGQSVAVLAGWERALGAVYWVTLGMLAVSLGLSVRILWRRPAGWERVALLWIWLLGPLAPLVLMPSAVGMHYMQIIVPTLFLALGLAWDAWLGVRPRALAVVGGALLVAVLLVQTGATVAIYSGVLHYPTAGGFGVPLRFWRQVQQGVQRTVVSAGESGLVVLGTDASPRSDTVATLSYLFRRGLQPRFAGQTGLEGLVAPRDRSTLVLLLSAQGEASAAVQRLGDEVARWPLPGDGWGVRLYRLSPDAAVALEGDITARATGMFDNGMRLLGGQLPATAHPGDVLRVATYWQYTQRPEASAAETSFNHLVDATGKRWAQADGFTLPKSQWRADELVVQWLTIALPADLPAGEYWLYTGMYAWQDGARAQLYDEQGVHLGDGARMGPVTVR
jgi:hypothetical protein